MFCQTATLPRTCTLTLISVPASATHVPPKQCHLPLWTHVLHANALPAQNRRFTTHNLTLLLLLLLGFFVFGSSHMWGRLRVSANKYCNDVYDFFYARLHKRSWCLSVYWNLFSETTTRLKCRPTWAQFEKICNIFKAFIFNEVTTWQKVIKNMQNTCGMQKSINNQQCIKKNVNCWAERQPQGCNYMNAALNVVKGVA